MDMMLLGLVEVSLSQVIHPNSKYRKRASSGSLEGSAGRPLLSNGRVIRVGVGVPFKTPPFDVWVL